jgi:hypothetical protein
LAVFSPDGCSGVGREDCADGVERETDQSSFDCAFSVSDFASASLICVSNSWYSFFVFPIFAS